jgi:hypothetical protein
MISIFCVFFFERKTLSTLGLLLRSYARLKTQRRDLKMWSVVAIPYVARGKTDGVHSPTAALQLRMLSASHMSQSTRSVCQVTRGH